MKSRVFSPPKPKKSLFVLFCEKFNIDYILGTQTTVRGKIIIKDRKWKMPSLGYTSSYDYELLPVYWFIINSSAGTHSMEVSKEVFDCMKEGEFLPITVKTGCFNPHNRIKIEITACH